MNKWQKIKFFERYFELSNQHYLNYNTYLSQLLKEERSKNQTNKIIQFVGSDPEKMEDLMSLFFHEEWRYNQWAAWPLGYIGCNQPQLIQPYHQKMINALRNPSHDSVARNILRIYGEIAIPEDIEGELYEICFNYLLDLKQTIAIRVFSMTVLGEISHKYPELQEELISVIEEFLPHGSAGFKSRAKKVLIKLKKNRPS